VIELLMPADAPDTALDDIRKAIRRHTPKPPDYGERVTVVVGERRVELGRAYRVTGTTECLADLMRVIPDSE
jgi:hypothetical protein